MCFVFLLRHSFKVFVAKHERPLHWEFTLKTWLRSRVYQYSCEFYASCVYYIYIYIYILLHAFFRPLGNINRRKTKNKNIYRLNTWGHYIQYSFRITLSFFSSVFIFRLQKLKPALLRSFNSFLCYVIPWNNKMLT